MDTVRKIYKQNSTLHHAYLILGDREFAQDSLYNFLENDLAVSTRGNPDFFRETHDTFGIDEARNLKSATAMKALSGKKFAVLTFNAITVEAQNSLLKMFEEPVGSTTFFVIAPSLEIFIPTLLSRFFIVDIKSTEARAAKDKKGDELAKKFLSSSPAKRISLIDDLVEKKDKIETINFFNSLENSLAIELQNNNFKKEIVSACNDIIKYKAYMYDRSPGVKMLLHHISCTIPVLEIKKTR